MNELKLNSEKVSAKFDQWVTVAKIKSKNVYKCGQTKITVAHVCLPLCLNDRNFCLPSAVRFKRSISLISRFFV